jgi:hypothetical protein
MHIRDQYTKSEDYTDKELTLQWLSVELYHAFKSVFRRSTKCYTKAFSLHYIRVKPMKKIPAQLISVINA